MQVILPPTPTLTTPTCNSDESCILIGNGTSVLDREMGSYIDTFDRVVRFNNYKIKSFEKFIGTKTTDWINVSVGLHHDRINTHYQSYIFHSWRLNIQPFSDAAKLLQKVVADKKSVVSHQTTLKEMAEFISPIEYKYFSTGAIGAWLYAKEFNKIHLYGFDWWNRETHHYGDREIRGKIHNPQIEKIFFEKLGDRAVFI